MEENGKHAERLCSAASSASFWQAFRKGTPRPHDLA
jgi:hypothetical protein